MTHILIVEDDGLIAHHLASVVTRQTASFCTCVRSVEHAKRELAKAVDFVFLDVNVTDGQTFDLARLLRARRVPFAFASGLNVADIPADLDDVLFLGKPYSGRAVSAALIAGLTKFGRGAAAIN